MFTECLCNRDCVNQVKEKLQQESPSRPRTFKVNSLMIIRELELNDHSRANPIQSPTN